VKREKAEFTFVNEHFGRKRNDIKKLYGKSPDILGSTISKTRLESLLIRRVKREKAEFTFVNEHFGRKRNDISKLYSQSLNRS
jgi:hypothetical protein